VESCKIPNIYQAAKRVNQVARGHLHRQFYRPTSVRYPTRGKKRAKSKADYRPNHGETAFMGRLSDPSSKEDVIDKVAFSPKHEWLEGTVRRLT
jgi:hypothetical protein